MQFTTRFYCFLSSKISFSTQKYHHSYHITGLEHASGTWLKCARTCRWHGWGETTVVHGWGETYRWRVSTLIFFFLFLPYFSVLTQKSNKRSQERPIAQPLDARGRPSFVSIEIIWVADAWCLSGCLLLIRDGIMRRASGASLHICGLYTHYIFADT